MNMRKSDREIKEIEAILDVLDRCDTIRLGLFGEEYPHVVPLSFGYAYGEGKVKIYIHGAKEGYKHALIEKNNRVCVEADIFHAYIPTKNAFSVVYESVIGFGTIKKADEEMKAKALVLILEHCGIKDFPAEKCPTLGATQVYEITLDIITGKKREI